MKFEHWRDLFSVQVPAKESNINIISVPANEVFSICIVTQKCYYE